MAEETPDLDEFVASAIGRLMSFWGFRRNLGRIWSLLFLSPSPLSAGELCERLQLSTGSVSMALKELQRWGAVYKSPVAGDRREFYQAEADIWGTVARVMKQRETREVDQVLAVIEEARRSAAQDLTEAAAEGDVLRETAAAYRSARIGNLQELAVAGKDLLSLLLGQDSVDQVAQARQPDGEVESADRTRSRLRIPRAPRDD